MAFLTLFLWEFKEKVIDQQRCMDGWMDQTYISSTQRINMHLVTTIHYPRSILDGELELEAEVDLEVDLN